jgi:hypothetical protein
LPFSLSLGCVEKVVPLRGTNAMRYQGKWVLLVTVVLATAGCKPALNYEKDFELKGVSDENISMPAITREQKVKVEIKTDEPVSVYVYLEKDAEAAEKDLHAKRNPSDNILSQNLKVEGTTTLEATIPARNGWIVRLSPGSKKSNVKVKITN